MTKSSVPEPKQRLFFKKSDEDVIWLRTQPISIHLLFNDAAMSDKWGDGTWRVLDTCLSGNTLKIARRKLQDAGLFKFRPMRGDSTGDARTIDGWEVINLHGASSDYYQKIAVGDSTDNVEQPTSIVEDSTDKRAESFASTEVSEPLDLLDLNRNKKTTTDLNPEAAVSFYLKEKEVVLAPTSSEFGASPKAQVIESANAGASPKAEDSREGNRKEPCRTSSESKNEHRHEEAESMHQPKSSAPPHLILSQSTLPSQETSLDAPVKSSAPAQAQSDAELFRAALAAAQPSHRGLLAKFCTFLSKNGKSNKEILDIARLTKVINTSTSEVFKDAIAAIEQNFPNIQNLPAYFRKAIEGEYKPAKAKAVQEQRERGAGDIPVYADDVDKSKPLWFLGEREWAELREWGWENDEEFAILVRYLNEFQCETVRISSIRTQFPYVEDLRRKKAKEAKAAEPQKPVDPELGF